MAAPAATQNTLEKLAESEIYAVTSPTEMPSNLQGVIALAKIMGASGFYPEANDAKKAAALMILAMQYGFLPVQGLTAIHVVKGKPMLHYSALLAKVRQHPNYDYEIVEQTAKKCVISWWNNKRGEWREIGRSEFTAEDAKRQGTQNMDKFPDTMLLARCASNGIKRFAPDALNGMLAYVQGEIEEDIAALTDIPGATKSDALAAELKAKHAAATAIDAEFRDADESTPEAKALARLTGDFALTENEVRDFQQFCTEKGIFWTDRALDESITDKEELYKEPSLI